MWCHVAWHNMPALRCLVVTACIPSSRPHPDSAVLLGLCCGCSKGLLEFDFESPQPQHVITQHYRLDLSVPRERAIAHDLRVRASIVPGENWWNETVDGLPFSLEENFDKSTMFPRRGVLELDYVVTRPQETAKRMVRDHFELDLSNQQVRTFCDVMFFFCVLTNSFVFVCFVCFCSCWCSNDASRAACATVPVRLCSVPSVRPKTWTGRQRSQRDAVPMPLPPVPLSRRGNGNKRPNAQRTSPGVVLMTMTMMRMMMGVHGVRDAVGWAPCCRGCFDFITTC